LRPEATLTPPSGRGTNDNPHAILEDVVTRLARLEERLDQLDRFDLGEPSGNGYILFLSTVSGYEIVERDAPLPPLGQVVRVDGKSYRVDRYRRSPFPGDPRPCVTAELAEQEDLP
jgi:hypothetical protein